jgi:CheY-like chemotaxis protein
MPQQIFLYIISSKDKDDSFVKSGAIGYGQKPLMEQDIDGILNELENFVVNHTKLEVDNQQENLILDDVSLSDLNILVVDDDIKNIFVLDSILGEYDANVFTAYNGEEALSLLEKNNNIDVILMDIMMPVMDGYEAIKRIRSNDDTKDIPIIAVTAKSAKDEKEKCIGIGANDFVTKPIDNNGLISLIKSWSDKQK